MNYITHAGRQDLGPDPLDGRRLEQAKLDAIHRNHARAARNAAAAREMERLAELSAEQALVRRTAILTSPTFLLSNDSEDLLGSAVFTARMDASRIPATEAEQIEFSNYALSVVNDDLKFNNWHDKSPLSQDEIRLLIRFMQTRGIFPCAESMVVCLMVLQIEGLFRPVDAPKVVIKAPVEEMEPMPVGEYDHIPEIAPDNPYPPTMTRRGQEVPNPQFEGYNVNARAAAIQKHDREKMVADARRELSPLVHDTMQELSTASGLKIGLQVINETLECFDTARPRLLLNRENLRACFMKKFFDQIKNPTEVFSEDELRNHAMNNYRGSAEDFVGYFGLGGVNRSYEPTFSRQRG